MDLFKMFFGNIFQRKGMEYRRNLESNIRRGTVGRVQAKATDAMSRADQKVMSAQNKATSKVLGDPRKAFKQKAEKDKQAQQAKPEPQKKQGGGGRQQSRAPQQGNQGGPGRAQGGGQPQKGVNPMWSTRPPGANGRAAASEGSWQPQQNGAQAQGGGFSQPAGGMANYGGGQPQERTQAIDIRGLEASQSRQVVGWIVAQSGNHRGMDFRLFEGKNVVGTAANCDIVVTDAYLSARHCTIRYDNGNFVIIDLDSRNGTFVNQKRISKEDLIDNDTIRLGKADFKFKSLF